MMSQVPGWELHEVASSILPGRQNHHPDVLVHDWKKVHLTLLTHAAHGLSENDFILAAKINKI